MKIKFRLCRSLDIKSTIWRDREEGKKVSFQSFPKKVSFVPSEVYNISFIFFKVLCFWFGPEEI